MKKIGKTNRYEIFSAIARRHDGTRRVAAGKANSAYSRVQYKPIPKVTRRN